MDGTRLINNICAFLDGLEDKANCNFSPSKISEYDAEMLASWGDAQVENEETH